MTHQPRHRALFDLGQIVATPAALAAMPDGDSERPVALANLQNIRTVLARPNLAPR